MTHCTTVIAATLLVSLCPALCGSKQLSFGVRDSVEMSRFSTISDFRTVEEDLFSPDHRQFFAITTRGILESNEKESTLWMFDVDRILQSGRAEHLKDKPFGRELVKMSAVGDGPSITETRWLEDGSGIAFLGRTHEERHVYVADTRSGTVRQLSPNGQDVERFDLANGALAYAVVASDQTNPRVVEPEHNVNSIVATGRSLAELLVPTLFLSNSFELWTVRDQEPIRVIDHRIGKPVVVDVGGYQPLRDRVSPFAVSPDGRFLVTLRWVDQIPQTWEAFEPNTVNAPIPKLHARASGARQEYLAQQYVVLDLQSGQTTELVDAPIGRWLGYDVPGQQAVWAPDGREVFLLNTYLSPTEARGDERAERLHRPCVVAVVNIETGKSSCMAKPWFSDKYTLSGPAEQRSPDFPDAPMRWRKSGSSLEVRYVKHHGSNDLVTKSYLWRGQTSGGAGSAKRASQALSSSKLPLHLFVQQDLNDPPKLVARDLTTGRSYPILDPNPQLEDLERGHVSVINWSDGQGHSWTGGLVTPPHYDDAYKYPLVLQGHGFDDKEFMTVGPFTTAFAAQPLASSGILVLQIDDLGEFYGKADEARVSAAAYQSAIEKLVADGHVDPFRVGVVGFSRTCFHVLRLLVASSEQVAAATIADGFDGSYWSFLLGAGTESWTGDLETVVGARPFGAGLKVWLTDSPGFNLDKVRAPIRIETIGSPMSLISEWGTYASLLAQKKPADLIWFPNGQHELAKPQEQYASEQGNVDWFRFWLKGEEDPVAAKAEQYRRWEKLCDMQRAQNPGQPAFCVPSKVH